MPSCSIKWCGKCSASSSYKKDGITFHRFPNNDIEMKEIWINATHRDNFFPTKHSVICSRHFTPDCFEALENNRRRLYRSSVPTLYLPFLTVPDDSKNTQDQSPPLRDIKKEDIETTVPDDSNNTQDQSPPLRDIKKEEIETDPLDVSTYIQAQYLSLEDVQNKPSASKSSEKQNHEIPEEQYENLTPRERKMKRHIDCLIYSLNKKKKDVKRFQDIVRLLKKKVARLQESLDKLKKQTTKKQTTKKPTTEKKDNNKNV